MTVGLDQLLNDKVFVKDLEDGVDSALNLFYQAARSDSGRLRQVMLSE